MKACLTALVTSLGLLLAALGSAAQDKARSYKYHWDVQVYTELTKAPVKARTKRNPLEKDPDAIAAGRNLFEQHCAECHGELAEGGRKGPSLLVSQIHAAEPGALFWLITNGVVWRGMPVWSKLPEPQRWQLVSYLKSLGVAEQSPQAPPPADPAAASPTAPPSRRH